VLRVDAFDVATNLVRQIPYHHHHHHHQQQQRAVVPSPFVRHIRITNDISSLCMAKTGNGGEGEGGGAEEPPQGTATVNIPLILQNLANQALIGCTIWSGGLGYTALTEQTQLGPGPIVFGIAGVIPMLALSRKIETSESPYVAGLNLSTNMAVLRLFGATPQPVVALLISFVVALLTGIVEETTFRGQALPAFAVYYGNGDVFIGALLSTLLFAVLHTNPLSFFKGGDAFMDNFALLILQIVNGAIFALLFVVSGNLAVPIITHTLYDLYTFYKTHMVDVAGQMQYAEEAMPICSSNTVEKKWISERGEDWLREAKQSFYLMDTNQDGELSRKELRVAMYQYGVNLSKVESQQVKSAADTDESGSIDFDEYLDYIGPLGSKYKAVRNTLLGPT
ncbi:MAG: membrane protease YdiL (CAAX protease family), partial [Bacillariaceae sp.]|jgi:membrane protease YdiL (CAAX protease family)